MPQPRELDCSCIHHLDGRESSEQNSPTGTTQSARWVGPLPPRPSGGRLGDHNQVAGAGRSPCPSAIAGAWREPIPQWQAASGIASGHPQEKLQRGKGWSEPQRTTALAPKRGRGNNLQQKHTTNSFRRRRPFSGWLPAPFRQDRIGSFSALLTLEPRLGFLAVAGPQHGLEKQLLRRHVIPADEAPVLSPVLLADRSSQCITAARTWRDQDDGELFPDFQVRKILVVHLLLRHHRVARGFGGSQLIYPGRVAVKFKEIHFEMSAIAHQHSTVGRADQAGDLTKKFEETKTLLRLLLVGVEQIPLVDVRLALHVLFAF